VHGPPSPSAQAPHSYKQAKYNNTTHTHKKKKKKKNNQRKNNEYGAAYLADWILH